MIDLRLLQVADQTTTRMGLRSSFNREHLVRGDIKLLNEGALLRAASSATCEKCAA
jgi:hypothetical protein